MKSFVGGIGLLAALLAVLAAGAYAQGCGIMIDDNRYLPDFDCDGVIDEMDNCPGAPNAQQRDINRNNVGDVCDMLIEEIIVNPDNHLRQGEFAHVTVRLLNNHEEPLRGATITVQNTELQIDARKELAFIPPGETAAVDFWLKIPKCARVKSYTLSVSAELEDELFASSEVETETITVERSDACGSANGSLDHTIINVFDRVDIDRGESKIIPITISNLGESNARYELSVQDLGNWGTWRIDPAPSIRLSDGRSDTAYLYLQTEENAPAGEKRIELTVTSGNQKTVIPILAYVRAPARAAAQPPQWMTLLQALFIILILILIIAALIIALRQRGKGPREETTKTETRVVQTTKKVTVEKAEDPKVETYY